MQDFPCTYDNSAGIHEEVTKNLNLVFPEAYMHWESMAAISKALKKHDKAAFCELPFCHTVEAEALGGNINYGNEKFGPRAGEYICKTPEEILELPKIDYLKGRIHEVLLTCRELRNQGEQVVLEVSGPFTILHVLIDAKYVFKAMRKQPELMKKVLWKLGEEILRFIEEAKKYGVQMVSYADSSGGVNILGPKMAAWVAEEFTYDFVKKAQKLTGENFMILLCPKTTLALIGIEKAEFADMEMSEVMNYGEACISMIGQARIAGQTCIKNMDYRLEDKIFKAVKVL